MESIKDYAGNTIDIYENRIEEELHSFYIRFADTETASDPAKLEKYIADSTQQRFNAALMHINKTVFNTKGSLKRQPYKYINNGALSNNNEYDLDILNNILNIYIYLCFLYDKQVSIHGYCYLTGIDRAYLTQWQEGGRVNVTPERLQLYQKLVAASETSLSDILAAGKRNPVGILGILNHVHGWNMPGVSREVAAPRSLSVDQLPKLGNMHNTQHAIEDRETSENKK